MNIEIITPQGQIFSQEIDSVIAPGSEGRFQVLKGHANMLSKLDVGVLKVEYNGDTDYFTCNGGVFEIEHDHINILTESSENYKDIDVARAEQAKQRAEERLAEKSLQVAFLECCTVVNCLTFRRI